MRILVSGSLAYDRIMNFQGVFSEHIVPEKVHTLNVSFMVEDMKESFGGNAGNISYNLALLGQTAAPVSTAGKDFGPYQDWLSTRGVDTSLIQIDTSLPTAFASILTDQKDNQITAFYPGAMKKPYVFSKEMFGEKCIGIIAPGNPDDMRELAKLFRVNEITFVYDPGQQIPVLSGDDLKAGMEKAGALVSNDYELAMIMKKTNWNENQILEHVEMIVTTLGEKGSHIRTRKEVIDVPAAKPKNTSDPTGAGDAYRAGLLYGFLHEWPLDICGKFAGVIACYTIESYGTQTHHFSFDEARLRYEENFKELLPTQ